MKNYMLIDMKVHGNEKGHLISIQKNINCPFDIKRCFYIFDTMPGVIRGSHANRKSEFLLIPINGSCKIKVCDGFSSNIVELNTPSKGLYLNKMIWKEMYDFSYNSILLVLTNTYYDENEYIRNYNDFLNEVKNMKGQ